MIDSDTMELLRAAASAAHDKKANEWYRNLERWMRKSQADIVTGGRRPLKA